MRIAALAALSLTSCSLIGTRRPDPPPYANRPDCNDSYARPIVDTALGGTGAAIAVLGGSMVARGTDSEGNSTVASGLLVASSGIAVAGLFLTSALIGYPRVSACHQVVAEWDKTHPEEKPVSAEERLARQYLRCPLDALSTRDLASWPPETHAWARRVITGCGRVAWCGEDDGRPRCGAPADLEFAVRQLAVETGCPAQTIEQLEFYGMNTQNTYRLNACGNHFSCLVPVFQERGRGEQVAGSVFGSQLTCKPVQQLTQPALKPEVDEPPPPPPPPPSGP